MNAFAKYSLPIPDIPSIFSAFVLRRQESGEIDLVELEFPVRISGEVGLSKSRTLLPKCKAIYQDHLFIIQVVETAFNIGSTG